MGTTVFTPSSVTCPRTAQKVCSEAINNPPCRKPPPSPTCSEPPPPTQGLPLHFLVTSRISRQLGGLEGGSSEIRVLPSLEEGSFRRIRAARAKLNFLGEVPKVGSSNNRRNPPFSGALLRSIRVKLRISSSLCSGAGREEASSGVKPVSGELQPLFFKI